MVISEAFDGARDRKACGKEVSGMEPANASLLFPIHHTIGRWMPFFPCRWQPHIRFIVQRWLLSLSLFLPHRFLRASRYDRLFFLSEKSKEYLS